MKVAKLDFKFWLKYIFSIIWLQLLLFWMIVILFLVPFPEHIKSAISSQGVTAAFIFVFLWYGRSIMNTDFSRYKPKSLRKISLYTSFISIGLSTYMLIKTNSFPSTAALLLSYLFTFPLALGGAWVGVKSFIIEL
tara:strand:+ start:35 stop:442 length:408 start_codon:yes stop_codon:yes gene_type:complete